MSLQLPLPFDAPDRPEEIFARVFRRLNPKHPSRAFQVVYHDWAQLRSAIRVEKNAIRVDLSDMLAGVSLIVLEALAEILIARLFSRRPSREARACYLACVMSPAMRQRIEEARRARGFKRMLPPRGRCFDLREVFDQLNRQFFHGELKAVRVGWSVERARTILGHHDPAHGSITISRILDSPSVPRLLVEYLVYHEMLHMRYPVERNHHRRVIHSAGFHEAERNFPQYKEARRLLNNARALRTRP